MENLENEHTYDNGFHPKEVHLKDNYKFYNNNPFFKLLSWIVMYITAFVLLLIRKPLWGYKVTGKKNLKKVKGAITISNHVLQQDAFCTVPALMPRKLYVTMLETNLGFPVVSQFLRIVGAVPIPRNPKLFVRFLKETEKTVASGKFVHIYPEAALKPYCDHIRPFKPGAFHIAYQSKAPIIPMVFTFHKPKGIYFYKRKPCIHLNILDPYYPDTTLSKKESINKMNNDLYEIISKFFNKNSDFSR